MAAALERWPDEPALVEACASLTERGGNHHRAAEQWQEAIAASRDGAGLKASRAAAIAKIGITPKSNDAFDMSPAELMLSFESLGDNCEFGMVQRLYGAEPRGLFRFSTLQPEYVLPALRCGFLGVGSLEQTFLDEVGGKYRVVDRRFRSWGHTANDAVPEQYTAVLQKVCRRRSMLRLDLLHKLRTGTKIFVYKSSRLSITDDEISRFHRMINRYGKNTVLVVRPQLSGKPNGTVIEVGQGVLHGYIDELSPPEDATRVRATSWLTICRRAYALWMKPNPAGAEPTSIAAT